MSLGSALPSRFLLRLSPPHAFFCPLFSENIPEIFQNSLQKYAMETWFTHLLVGATKWVSAPPTHTYLHTCILCIYVCMHIYLLIRVQVAGVFLAFPTLFCTLGGVGFLVGINDIVILHLVKLIKLHSVKKIISKLKFENK